MNPMKYQSFATGPCDGSQLNQPIAHFTKKIKSGGGTAGPCDGSQLNRPLPDRNEVMWGAGIHKNGNWYPAAKPPGTAPDVAVCLARRKIKGGLVYCHLSNAYACKFVTRVDYDLICCHPKRDEIVARTEAKRN
jgi:hypothetical protein